LRTNGFRLPQCNASGRLLPRVGRTVRAHRDLPPQKGGLRRSEALHLLSRPDEVRNKPSADSQGLQRPDGQNAAATGKACPGGQGPDSLCPVSHGRMLWLTGPVPLNENSGSHAHPQAVPTPWDLRDAGCASAEPVAGTPDVKSERSAFRDDPPAIRPPVPFPANCRMSPAPLTSTHDPQPCSSLQAGRSRRAPQHRQRPPSGASRQKDCIHMNTVVKRSLGAERKKSGGSMRPAAGFA
jgi:hypothetical protein